MSIYSERAAEEGAHPNDLRPLIDATDRQILRALVERGVIRGFYADIDPEAVGHSLQAIIAVRLKVDARNAIRYFADRLAEMAEVRNVFFIAGGQDFLVHVVAKDTANLRQFVVVNLSGSPEVASTETNLIFEHLHVQRL